MKIRLKVLQVNGEIRRGTYTRDREPTVIERVVERIMHDMIHGRDASESPPGPRGTQRGKA